MRDKDRNAEEEPSQREVLIKRDDGNYYSAGYHKSSAPDPGDFFRILGSRVRVEEVKENTIWCVPKEKVPHAQDHKKQTGQKGYDLCLAHNVTLMQERAELLEALSHTSKLLACHGEPNKHTTVQGQLKENADLITKAERK